MLLRFFKFVGSLAARFSILCPALVRVMPNPNRFLGWKAYERQLIIYRTPVGSLALANDPGIVETVLADRAGNFPKSAYGEAMLRPMIGRGLFGQPGGHEVKKRRKTYLRVLSKVPGEEVDRVSRGLVRDYLGRWMHSGEGVAVPRELSRLAIDIVTTVLLGERFDPRESERFVDLFFRYHQCCNPSVVFCVAEGSDELDRFVGSVGLAGIGDEMRRLIRDRFVAPWLDPAGGPATGDGTPPAFVHMLLEENDIRDPRAAETLLLDEIAVLILAGHETSASVLAWLFWEMSGQAELGGEVVASRGDGEEFNSRVEALMQEALRLYPPISFYLRDVVAPAEFRGRTLAARSWIAVSPWTLQRHRLIWPDAESFCPARWFRPSQGERPRAGFIPFGLGARFCPGKNFAEAEMRAIIEEVVLAADILRLPGREPKPLGHLTSRPDYDFRLRFMPRSPSAC
jgi:cytochrome P450